MNKNRLKSQEKINLYWYSIPGGLSNFGDELNWFIVSRLSRHGIRHIAYPQKGFKLLKVLLGSYHKGYINLGTLLRAFRNRYRKNVYVCVGSVISVSNRKDKIIWGAGIISANDSITEGDYRAVRGPYTARRLQQCGINPPNVYGDPALLLPLVWNLKVKPKFKLGLIPHHVHYKELLGQYQLLDEVIIIDLLSPVEEVIADISKCEFILSSSLHGLIVPHSYGIPSVWVDFGGRKLYGDDIKFRDYMASVDLPEYTKYEVDKPDIYEWYLGNRELWKQIMLPLSTKVSEVQKNLLNVKPF